eukprot:767048-Hanusia_phi.AAC.3
MHHMVREWEKVGRGRRQQALSVEEQARPGRTGRTCRRVEVEGRGSVEESGEEERRGGRRGRGKGVGGGEGKVDQVGQGWSKVEGVSSVKTATVMLKALDTGQLSVPQTYLWKRSGGPAPPRPVLN